MKMRAFTLVEVLVVLLVLTVLIAIVLPVFRRTKDSAGDIRSLSAIRQMHTAMALYTHEHNQMYPFFGIPGKPEAGIWVNGVHRSTGAQGAFFFWTQQSVYVSGLLKHLSGVMEMADGHPAYGPSNSPDLSSRDQVYVSTIVYSPSFLALPDFWKDGGPHDPRFIQPTRVSMVRHPPRKGLLVYSTLEMFQSNRVMLGFADGSVRQEERNMSRSIKKDPQSPFWLNDRAPGLITRDGVHGIDY